MYASICSLWHSASLCWHDELKSPCHGSCSSQCVSVPCLGPLAPRKAVGVRHDGLPRQFSPLMSVVCHGLSLSEGFASAMLSIQLFFGLPLLRLPSTVPCNITLVRLSYLVTCPYDFSFRRFTVVRRSSYGPICFMMVFRTCSLVIRSL